MKDYKQKSIEERQDHCELDTDCVFSTFPYRHKRGATNNARRELRKLLCISKEDAKGMECAHLCANDSMAEQVCCNPLHLYFATHSENQLDRYRGIDHTNYNENPACPHCGHQSKMKSIKHRKTAVRRHIRNVHGSDADPV